MHNAWIEINNSDLTSQELNINVKHWVYRTYGSQGRCENAEVLLLDFLEVMGIGCYPNG